MKHVGLALVLSLAACGSKDEVELRVLAPDGQPVLDAYVDYDGGALQGFGEHVFHVRPADAPFTVTASGFRLKRVASVEDDLDVVLQPGYSVKLTLPDDILLPDPPLFLCVELRHADDPHERFNARLRNPRPDWDRHESAPLAFRKGDRELSALVHAPGAYECRWSVQEVEWKRDGGLEEFLSHGSSPKGAEQRIDVKDAEGDQTFRLVIKPELLRETVDGFNR